MVGCLDAAPDYLSVPLAEAANAPVGLIPDPTRPPAGSLLLRGLPFELGPEPGRCLVHLAADGGAREAELTVGLRATTWSSPTACSPPESGRVIRLADQWPGSRSRTRTATSWSTRSGSDSRW